MDSRVPRAPTVCGAEQRKISCCRASNADMAGCDWQIPGTKVMKIVVASRSFAGNAALRAELSSRYPDVTYTDSPAVLEGDPLIAVLRGHDHAIVGLRCRPD